MSNQLYSLNYHYKKADKLMLITCGGLFLFTLALASWHNTWLEAFVIGLPSVGIAAFFYKTASGKRITRAVFASVFMIFSALNIHQGHGMIEIHFGIFGLLAFLLYYRDWLPVITASAVIAVHHISFFYLQTKGADVYIFETTNNFYIVLVHAAYVVFECGVLCYMAVNLHKEAEQTQELSNINSAVNEGVVDLTRRYDSQSPMVQGFNNFMKFLDDIIGESVKITAQFSETGNILSEKNQIVLSGVELQQMNSRKVESAVFEITDSSSSIAQSSARAEEIAADADRGMKEGLNIISGAQNRIKSLSDEVLGSCDIMKQLEENSQSIGGVLDVIRSIADQTNLLALNAAIEAARAGEQGRGFAVVADEVRSLASRTQESTEEIHTMIETLQTCTTKAVESSETSQGLAEKSVEDIMATTTLLKSLAETNQEIHQMSQDIAKNTGQQSSVIGTINELTSEMSTAATQAYEDCQQSVEACQIQINSASHLDSMMKKFLVS